MWVHWEREASVILCLVFVFQPKPSLCECVSVHASAKLITVDGFLVQGVDKVAGILYGVLHVTDGVHAAALAPQALLGSLRLVLQFTKSGLLWTGHTHMKSKG